MNPELFLRVDIYIICNRLLRESIEPLAITEGVEVVKVSMGPKGRIVIIDQGHGTPKLTKNGVVVAESITFEGKAKNVGVELVKQVTRTTNKVAGDGITCAIVLTQVILMEGFKFIIDGTNVMDFATDLESELLTTLIINKHHGGIKLFAVKFPGLRDNRRANLDDNAVFTGAVWVFWTYSRQTEC